MKILVHELSQDPTTAWDEILSKSQRVIQISLESSSPEIPKNKIRIVCMSDTHSLTSKLQFEIPEGDVFIHAGDFTSRGRLDEVIEFNNWIAELPHKYKIVIAGNHELSFDDSCTHPYKKLIKIDKKSMVSSLDNSKDIPADVIIAQNVKNLLTNCIYLEDQAIEVYGLKIYGTPWQPEFRRWAFNATRGKECLGKWNQIPANVDILITHSPPIGHGDLCDDGLRAGCVELLASIQQRIKPKYHVFGHIHEGYGITSDGTTIFINASTCNIDYLPVNPPVVFDMMLPQGKTNH